LQLHEEFRVTEVAWPAVRVEAKKVRARKMIRELRSLGYQVTLVSPSDGLGDFRPWLISKAA
jgi:hypothetical protein